MGQLKEIMRHIDPNAKVETWSPEKVRHFEESMRETTRKLAEEKQQQRNAYLAQEVVCPACKETGTVGAWAKHESNGKLGPGGMSWISHLECPKCRIHFGAPDGEIVMTGHDRIDLSM